MKKPKQYSKDDLINLTNILEQQMSRAQSYVHWYKAQDLLIQLRGIIQEATLNTKSYLEEASK